MSIAIQKNGMNVFGGGVGGGMTGNAMVENLLFAPRGCLLRKKKRNPVVPTRGCVILCEYRKGGAQMSICALSVADAITLSGLWIAGTGTLLKSSKLYCLTGAVIAIVGFVLEH